MAKPRNDLTADYVRSLLNYNQDTGDLVWKVAKVRRARIGNVAGGLNTDGYIHVMIDGRLYRAHRLAWLMAYGQWPEDQIDHINGDRADNRLSNLREASPAENQQNIASHKDSTSRFVGVCWDARTSKWRAQIRINGKPKHLGRFHEEKDAAAAYDEAKSTHHRFNPTVRPSQVSVEVCCS